MSHEEDLPKTKSETIGALIREDLTVLGIEELEERITLLGEEIERCREMVVSKQGSRSAADAIFSK